MNKYKVGQKYVGRLPISREETVIQINRVDKSRIAFDVIKGSHPLGWCDIGSYFEENLKPLQEKNANQKEIHITTDGIKNVYGVLKENGKVVKKAMAKCHPSDTFDFEIGVATVMDRLLEKAKEAEKVVEVKRTAKEGEYVKVIARHCNHQFKIGQVVKCMGLFLDLFPIFSDGKNIFAMGEEEYIVLENYRGE